MLIERDTFIIIDLMCVFERDSGIWGNERECVCERERKMRQWERDSGRWGKERECVCERERNIEWRWGNERER